MNGYIQTDAKLCDLVPLFYQRVEVIYLEDNILGTNDIPSTVRNLCKEFERANNKDWGPYTEEFEGECKEDWQYEEFEEANNEEFVGENNEDSKNVDFKGVNSQEFERENNEQFVVVEDSKDYEGQESDPEFVDFGI